MNLVNKSSIVIPFNHLNETVIKNIIQKCIYGSRLTRGIVSWRMFDRGEIYILFDTTFVLRLENWPMSKVLKQSKFLMF